MCSSAEIPFQKSQEHTAATVSATLLDITRMEELHENTLGLLATPHKNSDVGELPVSAGAA